MKNKRASIIYIVLFAVFAGVSVLSFFCGSADLTFPQMLSGILGREGYKFERIIMLSIRLPRLIAAIVAGAGLSISGVILQSVMGNPLASPNTIGVNAGAGLAIVICLTAFPAFSAFLPFAAFFGAFFTALIILFISRTLGAGKTTVILAGIACTSLFGAGISFLSILDTDVLSTYSAFSVGGFSGVALSDIALPAILVAVCFFISVLLSGRVAALSLGDAVAASLGVNVRCVRMVCIVIASMSAAAVVSFSGLLGFVGLIVPHIARKIVGENILKQLTAAPIVGGIIVILSDFLGRSLFSPSEISVGIIMSFIGAPFFFFILFRRRKKTDA
ncbi:MAG: iron ABC transporter permease [Clostridia bacterium]|nr:iron ABC transporter permease [Clostridia bacterium]